MPIALTTFGAPGRQIFKGDEVAADDPVIKGREHLFETLEPTAKKRPAKRRAAAKSDD